jgi:hypothetical protein
MSSIARGYFRARSSRSPHLLSGHARRPPPATRAPVASCPESEGEKGGLAVEGGKEGCGESVRRGGVPLPITAKPGGKSCIFPKEAQGVFLVGRWGRYVPSPVVRAGVCRECHPRTPRPLRSCTA